MSGVRTIWVLAKQDVDPVTEEPRSEPYILGATYDGALAESLITMMRQARGSIVRAPDDSLVVDKLLEMVQQ